MPSFVIKFLSVVVGILTSFSLACAPATQEVVKSNFKVAESFDRVQYEDQLVPEKDTDGNWTFNTDRDLKVLQFTDVHIGGGALSIQRDKRAMNAVAAMITAEKPDLVVYTGDMAYPVPFQAGTFNNSISTSMFIKMCEKLGVYYTVVFGNHDAEFYGTHSREQIADMYADPSLKYSLFQKGPDDVDGYGNQIIKVKNSKGIVTNAYFLFDSHDYVDGDILGIQWKYDNIHDNQIEWYKDNVNAIKAANEAIDPSCPLFTSLAFLHIPPEEYQMAWDEYKENGYQNTENVQYEAGGFHEKDEKSYHGIYPDNFFETLLEMGSTKAIFCGHDHINNAILNYKGIKLVYGNSIDYLAYSDLNKKGAQRGCTVINLKQNGDLSVSLENYYQDKYETKYPKENVEMQW